MLSFLKHPFEQHWS